MVGNTDGYNRIIWYRENKQNSFATIPGKMLRVFSSDPMVIQIGKVGFLFSRLGLNWFWLTFPITEVITSLVGVRFYRQFLAKERGR